ncbi:hypothetical protein [Galbibacter sp.]|uniref:hypothetical protein n=1 Tax=Galbibacter sp. TaxID=2918471 RepID=UPI003A90FC0F
METKLKEHLWEYIIAYNPELMYSLMENYSVAIYLTEKIKSIQPQLHFWRKIGYPEPSVFLLGMGVLTSDLRDFDFN